MIESMDPRFITNSSSMAALVLVLRPEVILANMPNQYEDVKQECENHPFITKYLKEMGCDKVAEKTKEYLPKAFKDLKEKMKQTEPYQITISASIDGEGIHVDSSYYYAMMIVADTVFYSMKDVVEKERAIIFGTTRTNYFNRFLKFRGSESCK